jgi:hypothetical protein
MREERTKPRQNFKAATTTEHTEHSETENLRRVWLASRPHRSASFPGIPRILWLKVSEKLAAL